MNNANKNNDAKHEKLDLVKGVLICGLVVLVIRCFLVEPFKIPSSSMVPTLLIGDYVFVSKFSYALYLPFTKKKLIEFNKPKRGDIIVFLYPRDEAIHYVKRVVGEPGDKIEVDKGHVKVNGTELFTTDLNKESLSLEQKSTLEKLGGNYYLEKLVDKEHLIRHSTIIGSSSLYSKQTFEVPDNKYFVMGDNRDDSYDSRSWGFVPYENIRGKAMVVWISFEQDSSLSDFSKLRWNRFGTFVK